MIFYIAALLAPGDQTKMTISSMPEDGKQFAKTAAGIWVLAADASEWKITADSVIVQSRRAGGKEERRRVASLIDTAPGLAKSLQTHDWSQKPTLNLSGGLTIEKMTDGFKIHAPKEEDTPALDFRVVYSK